MRSTVSIPRGSAYGADESFPSSQQGLSVADAVYHTGHKYPGGVHALAVRMGMSGNTLQHKVNPNTTTHLLSIEESVAMQEISGTNLILQAMASRLGCTVVSSVPAGTDDPHALYWQMAALVADLQHAVADAFERGVTGNSMRRCDGLAAEAISAINNLLAGLRAELPTPPKAFDK